ncbi:MAG: transposase [Lysobacterales bacterium]|jgi:transposase
MKRKSPQKYDETFKRAAVVEQDLGISQGSIYNWRKALEKDAQSPFPGKGHQRPNEAEISQLLKENRRLQRECDILKKAVAIFSDRP